MTIRSIIDTGNAEAVAISALNRSSLSYRALRNHCDQIGRQLASQGLSNSDRVAIVLPNGPEMDSFGATKCLKWIFFWCATMGL